MAIPGIDSAAEKVISTATGAISNAGKGLAKRPKLMGSFIIYTLLFSILIDVILGWFLWEANDRIDKVQMEAIQADNDVSSKLVQLKELSLDNDANYELNLCKVDAKIKGKADTACYIDFGKRVCNEKSFSDIANFNTIPLYCSNINEYLRRR